jgi:hypothetical protein
MMLKNLLSRTKTITFNLTQKNIFYFARQKKTNESINEDDLFNLIEKQEQQLKKSYARKGKNLGHEEERDGFKQIDKYWKHNESDDEIVADESKGVYGRKDFKDFEQNEDYKKALDDTSPEYLTELREKNKTIGRKIRRAERRGDTKAVEEAKKEQAEVMKDLHLLEKKVE